MTDPKKTVTYRLEIEGYLKQLSELTGKKVIADQLSSLEEVEQLKASSRKLVNYKKITFIVPLDSLLEKRFLSYIKNLERKNVDPVSIWLGSTSDCGVFYIPKISDFNFSFKISTILDGVIVLLTNNAQDKLLLDFTPEEVEIEVQGHNWGSVKY